MPTIVRSNYDFPRKLAPLFTPAPYKVIEGGRGKGASWGFARAALILGEKRKLFIVAAREIQKSIEESVKKLFEDQIEAMGYHEHIDKETGELIPARYVAYDDEIRGSNGTRIVFVGVRTHIRKIKSMEGIDIFWCVEATHFSQLQWTILMPTIRRDAPYGPFGKGSELWVDFNPELATDYTYRYWRQNPPEGTIVISASWRDNPWFPDRMKKEMLKMRKDDHDTYMNVYEGRPLRVLKGAIYVKEYTKALTDVPPRISPDIKFDRKRPVDVAWDLGRADTCSGLFMQQVGTKHVAGDYYGNVGFDWSHYIEEMQERRYILRNIYLPHDAKNKVIQALLSIYEQTVEAFPNADVILVKRPESRTLSVNAGRQLFGRLYVDEIACADWLHAMQHYQYDVKPDPKDSTQVKRSSEPLHNWASHPADAWHTYALGQDPEMQEDREELDDMGILNNNRTPHPQGWMAS